MAGDAFTAGENMVGTGKVAKMNQKTRFRGTGAEVSAMSGDDGPHPGQEAFISATGSGFTINKVYRRNNADTAWQEMADVSNGRAFDANLFVGLDLNRFQGPVDHATLVGAFANQWDYWNFIAPTLTDNFPWVSFVFGGGIVSISGGQTSKIGLTAGANGDRVIICHNNVDNYRRQSLIVMEWIADLSTISNNMEMRVGFTDGALSNATAWPQGGNYACWEIDSVVNSSNNVFIESNDGTRSHFDTGYLPASTNRSRWRLELDDSVEGSANEIRLYRNDGLIGTKTTNLPATATDMQPFVYVERVSVAARQIQIFVMRIRTKTMLITA